MRVLPVLPLIVASAILPAAQAQDGVFLERMQSYLSIARDYVELAANETAAVYFAVEGIVEIYEARNDPRGAIEHLERLLDQHGEDRAVRNIIRFKLRDIYRETRRGEQALQQLEAVIRENAGD